MDDEKKTASWRSFLQPAVFRGGDALQLAEISGQRVGVVVADALGDLGDGELGLAQELLCARDPVGVHILGDAGAAVTAEKPRQVPRADADALADRVDAQILVPGVRFDIKLRVLHETASWSTGAAPAWSRISRV